MGVGFYFRMCLLVMESELQLGKAFCLIRASWQCEPAQAADWQLSSRSTLQTQNSKYGMLQLHLKSKTYLSRALLGWYVSELVLKWMSWILSCELGADLWAGRYFIRFWRWDWMYVHWLHDLNLLHFVVRIFCWREFLKTTGSITKSKVIKRPISYFRL